MKIDRPFQLAVDCAQFWNHGRTEMTSISVQTGPTSVDYSEYAYTGPDTLAGRYLRRFWHPIFHSDELQPGHAKPIKLLGEDFTLFRGESGTPHVIASRCAHRGMQLSAGWIEGDRIRCFYHGWKYDGTGQCVEQPAEPKPFSQKVKIPGYPTKEYLGLIWTYIGEGEPVPFPRYPDFEDFEGVLYVQSALRRCNYFNNVENGLDPAHVGFVHRGLEGGLDGSGDRLTITAEETDWGIMLRTRWSSGKVGVSQFGMPNILHLKALPKDPDISAFTEFLTLKVPVDDENHIQYLINKYPLPPEKQRRYWELHDTRVATRTVSHQDLADEILAGRLRREDVDQETTEFLRVQDDVAQAGQGIFADRKNERLGRSDAGIILMRKLWTRELRALAEGRPLKQWKYNPEERLETFREQKNKAEG